MKIYPLKHLILFTLAGLFSWPVLPQKKRLQRKKRKKVFRNYRFPNWIFPLELPRLRSWQKPNNWFQQNLLQTPGQILCILPVISVINTGLSEQTCRSPVLIIWCRIRFGGNYQVSGSKCLCTAGIPVTPWISGNCGFSPQPLRKVNMALSSSLQFLPNYQVHTTTIINQIQPVDKCAVSVFSSDITQLVMDSIRSSLAAIFDRTGSIHRRFEFYKIRYSV